MSSRILKSILCIGLAVILLFMPFGLSFAGEDNTVSGFAASMESNAQIKSKDEVVYGRMAADGSVQNIYIINHFGIDKGGNITDYGNYASVANLTDTTPLTQTGDAVTFQANGENFYYQGDMAITHLPWIFDIIYFLDGTEITSQELAGQSGKLDIHISTQQNTSVHPDFYENYMLQVSITLDTEKCKDIKAPDASVASAGKNKVIAYTLLPGKDGDISLSTTVQDFTMAGMDISALPFSMNMELPDTDSMIKDFTDLSAAISDLNDGVGKLAGGIANLKTGAGKLTKGSSDIKTGLSRLSANSGQLIQASSQIGSALTQIASGINGSSGQMGLGDLVQLPQGLSQLANGLETISGSLMELKDGFTSAYGALDEAINRIPEATVSEEDIKALYTQTPTTQHDTLDQLIHSYGASQTVKSTYNQVKDAFSAVEPAIGTLSGSINTISATLNDMSEKIGDGLSDMDLLQQLTQLSEGFVELEQNYGKFHHGLKDYMNGVDALSSGYAGFHHGLSSFGDGVGELYSGVAELHGGTTQLNRETAELPYRMQSEIRDMLKEYTLSDFQPISFTSSKNKDTDLVQFVLKCDGIKKPEEQKTTAAETTAETFWDRLRALFTKAH